MSYFFEKISYIVEAVLLSFCNASIFYFILAFFILLFFCYCELIYLYFFVYVILEKPDPTLFRYLKGIYTK